MARELYFVHNGKQYDCGTVVVLKNDYLKVQYERVFLCYLVDADAVLYQRKDGGAISSMQGNEFRNNIVECKNEICTPMRDSFLQSTSGYNRAPTFKEELIDDNLLIVWMWYIFIMVVAIIFKDRIGIWILTSFVFFRYRIRKLRERGFKL